MCRAAFAVGGLELWFFLVFFLASSEELQWDVTHQSESGCRTYSVLNVNNTSDSAACEGHCDEETPTCRPPPRLQTPR